MSVKLDKAARETKMRIAAQLKAARIERGLTQQQLGDEIGQVQEAISRIESGTHSPSLGTLIQLCVALGKRVEIN